MWRSPGRRDNRWPRGAPLTDELAASIAFRLVALVPTVLGSMLMACGAPPAPPGTPSPATTPRMSCVIPETEFSLGEELPPPALTIDNPTVEDIELVGPTATVVGCTLVQPDGVEIPMRIAMPTGRSPYDMPKRLLEAGARLTFTPRGIWTYRNESGFAPYGFPEAGTYGFFCRYEDLTSNTVTFTVR